MFFFQLSDSDDGYTPLSRPELTVGSPGNSFTIAQKVSVVAQSSSDDNYSSETSDDSDTGGAAGIKKTKKRKEIKVKPMKPTRPVARVRPEKYNIWAQTLQEDLTENMRGCEVRNNARDRDVESYDYNIKYRINGEMNPGKRRQSYSDDSDTYTKVEPKRFKGKGQHRVSAKLRLGKRQSTDSCDGINSVARHILDLAVTKDSSNEEVAQEMAMKLCEEKDDLLLQAINVVGKDVPMKLFADTQRIELDGGMMTINGQRRRTPGGVFLFLLKNCADISDADKKKIFVQDRKLELNKRRNELDVKLQRKVQKLKQSLTLTAGSGVGGGGASEEGGAMSLLKPNPSNVSLSNPPPSPVTDCNRESSPDFEATTIVNRLSEKSIAAAELSSGESNFTETAFKPDAASKAPPTVVDTYEDDFLDVTYDDNMDIF